MSLRIVKSLIVLSLLLLVSCSRTHLALQFIDDVIAYEVSSDFDFNGKDDDQVEVIAFNFVRDFKLYFFPFLIKEIENSIDTLNGIGLKANFDYNSNLKSQLDRFTLHLEAGQPIYSKYISQLMQLVRKDHWEHYLKDFENENSKILKKKQRSRLEENFERFLGELNKGQVKLIEEFQKTSIFSAQMRVSNRQATINRFNELMGQPFSQEKLEQITLQWIKAPGLFGDPETQKFYSKRRLALIDLTAEILKLMEPRQKKHLLSTLKSLRDDLNEDLSKILTL